MRPQLLLTLGLSLVAVRSSTVPAESAEGELLLKPSGKIRHQEKGREMITMCSWPGEEVTGKDFHWTHAKPGGAPVPIMADTNYDIVPMPHSSQLIISKASGKDEGTYTCTGKFGGIEKSASFELQIFEGLSFSHFQPNQTAVVGQEFNLRCDVQGNPTPTFIWVRNSTQLENHAEGELSIPKVTRSDAGVYTCMVSQDIEGVTSQLKKVHLTVQYPPEMSDNTMVVVPSGGIVNLTCDATGEPAPEITWGSFHDSFVPLENPEFLHSENRPGFSTIVINTANKTSSDLFACRAKNSVGFVFRNYTFEPAVLKGVDSAHLSVPTVTGHTAVTVNGLGNGVRAISAVSSIWKLGAILMLSLR